jgi:DNA-binding response OmpR family regulator
MSSTHDLDKVLVVYDDPVRSELLSRILQEGGFEPIVTGSGERALLLLIVERGSIDWLITKRCLPGLVCGAVLADEFHRAHPDRAVIYGCSRQADRGLGGNAMVVRAIAPMRILSLLNRLRAGLAVAAASPRKNEAA